MTKGFLHEVGRQHQYNWNTEDDDSDSFVWFCFTFCVESISFPHLSLLSFSHQSIFFKSLPEKTSSLSPWHHSRHTWLTKHKSIREVFKMGSWEGKRHKEFDLDSKDMTRLFLSRMTSWSLCRVHRLRDFWCLTRSHFMRELYGKETNIFPVQVLP